MHLYFDSKLSREVKHRIFHLYHYVGAQKVSDLGTFLISDFWTRNVQLVFSVVIQGEGGLASFRDLCHCVSP